MHCDPRGLSASLLRDKAQGQWAPEEDKDRNIYKIYISMTKIRGCLDKAQGSGAPEEDKDKNTKNLYFYDYDKGLFR